MRSSDFVQWLQGYFDLSENEAGVGITQEQVEIIKAHLNMVFYHEIDPSYGKDSEKLTELHEEGKRKQKSHPMLNGPVSNYMNQILLSANSIPKDLILKYTFLPIKNKLIKGGSILEIIIPDSEINNLEMLDNLRFRLGCEIECYVASKHQIEEFINSYFKKIEIEKHDETPFIEDGYHSGYDGSADNVIVRC